MKQKSKQYNATHLHIQRCFLELLESQSYETITVTAVSKQAGINRKTFYLHYASLDALLEECTLRCVDAVSKGVLDALIEGVKDEKLRPGHTRPLMKTKHFGTGC